MNHEDMSASRPQELDAIDEIEPAAKYTTPSDAWPKMRDALEQLRVAHLPFRLVTPEDVRQHEEMRGEVIDMATSDPVLVPYYEEAWNGVRAPASAPIMALRRIVMKQLQLMECMFFTLQLQRYASAPENAGWIDLFRRWGASPSFNRVFDEIDRTLAPDFVAFYLAYLRTSLPHSSDPIRLWDQPRMREPLVHHPWLQRPGVDRGHGTFMDSGLADAPARDETSEMRPGAGGVLDAKGSPGPDQTYEVPSDAPQQSNTPQEGEDK